MVSIILPIRNEHNHIAEAIQSIYDQKIREEYEIIISDGMSTDGTREIIKDIVKNHTSIKIIDNPQKIVSSGFNAALSISKGNYIVRLDGHAKLCPNYINKCLSLFKEIDAECIGGYTRHFPKSFIGENISIAQTSTFGAGGASFRTGVYKGKYVDTLAFGVYKRSVFKKIGGYDIELVRNQDEEFNYRLIQNGGKIWLDPSISSIYYVRNSVISFIKQYFNYGFYKVRVIQKIRSIFSIRHLIPGIFVFSIIASTFMALTLHYFIPIKLLVFSYLTINLSFTLYESIKSKFKHSMFLPLIFFLMHFSYGFGFLLGLFYFIRKWRKNTIKDSSFNKEEFLQLNIDETIN